MAGKKYRFQQLLTLVFRTVLVETIQSVFEGQFCALSHIIHSLIFLTILVSRDISDNTVLCVSGWRCGVLPGRAAI